MWINGEKDTGKLVEFPSFAGILLWKTQWKVFITVRICLFFPLLDLLLYISTGKLYNIFAEIFVW